MMSIDFIHSLFIVSSSYRDKIRPPKSTSLNTTTDSLHSAQTSHSTTTTIRLSCPTLSPTPSTSSLQTPLIWSVLILLPFCIPPPKAVTHWLEHPSKLVRIACLALKPCIVSRNSISSACELLEKEICVSCEQTLTFFSYSNKLSLTSFSSASKAGLCKKKIWRRHTHHPFHPLLMSNLIFCHLPRRIQCLSKDFWNSLYVEHSCVVPSNTITCIAFGT